MSSLKIFNPFTLETLLKAIYNSTTFSFKIDINLSENTHILKYRRTPGLKPWATLTRSTTPTPFGCGVEERAKTDSKIVIMHNKILVTNPIIPQMYH